MTFSLNTIAVGTGLMLLQVLLALPWLSIAFLTQAEREQLRQQPFPPWLRQRLLIALAACVGLPILLLMLVQDKNSLEVVGRLYGAALQLQLTLDAFIAGFFVLLWAWPKGGAVALAAFREGVRQWMFWMLTGLGALFMVLSIFVPYFTFGEDYLMVKQLGYDTIMLVAVLFGGLTASLSISEEIEGRTAITVMSKPVSRRQFMLGKFAGIILAALFMFGALGVIFEGVLLAKHWWDRLEVDPTQSAMTPSQTYIGVSPMPAWVNATLEAWALPGAITDVLRGVGQWTAHTLDTMPGLVLCFFHVMVLVGLAVALATRLPMVVNLTTVLVVFFLSHLTPVLVAIAGRAQETQPGAVPRLLGFVAGVFDTVLPDLASFSMDPALLSDAPPDPALFARYVGSVTLYGIVYTAIVLLFGLILFEDRDLA
jgi:ABC-type transport system involved in multi-copper enzyme maturation permease subunit